MFDAKIPSGALTDKWDNYKANAKLVNPNNKRKFKIIVVGTGLAGASAAATLAELGYQVDAFTFHDSPRRAHSIAAQGGINAAKNYQGDGDSINRLFQDTIKGGDFRSREANVHRLAQVSVDIIDQMVAQGVPFAREYGGQLDNRSFGGAQVSRTFYARGQTGQQLLIGAYQQMARQVGLGGVRLFNRTELIDTVTIDGRCAGIVVRDLLTGEIQSHSAHAVVLATGGYGNVFFLSTNAMNCNVTAAWRAHRRGAMFANPCYTQIHPTCIPQADETQSKLTLMSESLRNDGRVWVPKSPTDNRSADQIPEAERDYFLERLYPSYGNLAPRDISSRAAKRLVDKGQGIGPLKNGVNLDFSAAIERLGFDVEVVPPVVGEGERVSSSALRAALQTGDFDRAARLLGRRYAMRGRVVAGQQLGRTLGFPTANIRLRRRRSPLGGIFAVRVHGIGPEPRGGVASLGTRPTVGGVEPLLETFVFDFAGDLYGLELEVEFVAHLRAELRFESLELLVVQMRADEAAARERLA